MTATDVAAHGWTVWAWMAMGALMLAQLGVVDVLGLRSGHQPGSPVPFEPQVAHFRATRALGNTNESIAVFVLLTLFCIGSDAHAGATAAAAWACVGFRVAHTACYWAGLALARSLSFAGVLLSLVALLVIGLAT